MPAVLKISVELGQLSASPFFVPPMMPVFAAGQQIPDPAMPPFGVFVAHGGDRVLNMQPNDHMFIFDIKARVLYAEEPIQ